MTHHFPNFLTNEAEYLQAEAFWASVWADIPELDRRRGGWRCGWFERQSLKDANPIFTAISDSQHRAIRVIQYEPTCAHAELDYWFDTFDGEADEPNSVRELVIACALSDDTAQMARTLMSSWVQGEEVEQISTPHGVVRRS